MAVTEDGEGEGGVRGEGGWGEGGWGGGGELAEVNRPRTQLRRRRLLEARRSLVYIIIESIGLWLTWCIRRERQLLQLVRGPSCRRGGRLLSLNLLIIESFFDIEPFFFVVDWRWLRK